MPFRYVVSASSFRFLSYSTTSPVNGTPPTRTRWSSSHSTSSILTCTLFLRRQVLAVVAATPALSSIAGDVRQDGGAVRAAGRRLAGAAVVPRELVVHPEFPEDVVVHFQSLSDASPQQLVDGVDLGVRTRVGEMPVRRAPF